MKSSQQSRITESHLSRKACIYVRQATLFRDASADVHYALRARALSWGWPPERTEVIDSDLGRSGLSVRHRSGFRRLTEETARGRVGLLALEISRLARTPTDWQRLLALCARTGTLVGLDQVIYEATEAGALTLVAEWEHA